MPRRIIDEFQDAAVLSFAVWTLLYSVGLATQWSLWPSGWLWLLVTVLLVAWRVLAAVRAPRAAAAPAAPAAAAETDAEAGSGVGAGVGTGAGPDDDPRFMTRRQAREARAARAGRGRGDRGRWALVLGLVGVLVAAVGGLVWQPRFFAPTFAATLLGVLALLVWSHLRGWPLDDDGSLEASASTRAGDRPAYPRRSLLEDAGVLLVLLVVSVGSLFIHLADTDDPYYLNRSVWVAQHGNAALRDTMFSPEVFNSPYGGGVPIASVEALFGVVAHMTGTLAGTVTYLVVTPVATALAIWALWRLARAWAPRRPFLVLLGAVAFLLLSGDSMIGNFWIPRIWQGKVIAVAVLIPLIWTYLTEAHAARTPRERQWSLLMLLAAGVALEGMTPTAVIWGPVLLGAVLLAALLLRSGMLALGGVAMAVGPFVGGAVVVLFSSGVGGHDPVARTAQDSFHFVLGGMVPMVALVLVVLVLSPLLARAGAPAALAGCSALASVAVFSPGVLPVVNAVTGSGPILWRFLFCAPIPILVGLLLGLPAPRLAPARAGLARAVPVAGVAVVVLALVAGGRPIWAYTGHGGPVTVTARPQWKLDVSSLDDVRQVAARHPHGEVLLPPKRMKVLTMYTTDFFPLVPREWFIRQIKEPREDRTARRLLYGVAAGKHQPPPQQEVTQALDLLGVDLACTGVSPHRKQVLAAYRGAGYTRVSRAGSLTCAAPARG